MQYPEICALKTSRKRALRRILVAAVLTLLGLWMGLEGKWIGWLAFGACAIGLLIAVVTCLPGASGLVVMPDGFVVRSLYRTRHYDWENVSPFEVILMEIHHTHGWKRIRMVGFNDSTAGKNLSAAMSGCNRSLPETYGMEAEALAAELNAYRAAALAEQRLPQAS